MPTIHTQAANPRLSGGGSGLNNRDDEETTKHFKPMQNISFKPPPTPINTATNTSSSSSRNNNLSLLNMTSKQTKFINDTMVDIRANEMENHHLRRQDEMEGQQAVVALKRQRRTTSSTASTGKSSSAPILNQNNTSRGWTSMFLDQLSLNPQIGQLVATSGGLVTYCKFNYLSF